MGRGRTWRRCARRCALGRPRRSGRGSCCRQRRGSGSGSGRRRGVGRFRGRGIFGGMGGRIRPWELLSSTKRIWKWKREASRCREVSRARDLRWDGRENTAVGVVVVNEEDLEVEAGGVEVSGGFEGAGSSVGWEGEYGR